MKKAELELKVQDALGEVEFVVNKKESALVTDTVFKVVYDAIIAGEEVTLGKIGKLTTTERAARTARNIQTGEQIEVPACTVPKAKFSKTIKEELKNK